MMARILPVLLPGLFCIALSDDALAQDALAYVAECDPALRYLNRDNWLIAPYVPGADTNGWHLIRENQIFDDAEEVAIFHNTWGSFIQPELNQSFNLYEFHLVDLEAWQQVTVVVFRQYLPGLNGLLLREACTTRLDNMEEEGLQ